jgi:subtilisin family serine protease
VLIAIVEMPFDYTHPDLKDHVWTNHLECCGQAHCSDDDQDGLPDCVPREAIADGCPGRCGVDDDGDGFTDWDDPEVRDLVRRLCTNELDDDGDDQADEPAVLGQPANCHGEEALAAEDDDENGHIDDAHGFNFQAAAEDGERAGGTVVIHPDLTIGHTTGVAGVIAATINNGQFTAGVHPKVRVAMVSIGHPIQGPYGLAFDVTDEMLPDAFRYASNIGADLVNMSWGARVWESDFDTEADYRVQIQKHTQFFFEGLDTRILYSTGAGNDNTFDLDYMPDREPLGIWTLPQNVETDYLLVVTATNMADLYAQHWSRPSDANSNNGGSYGATTVDFAAPGDHMGILWSPDVDYKINGGTSFSAPLTAAVAGLVISRYPADFRGHPLRTTSRLVQTLDTPAESPNLSSLCPPGGPRRARHCGRVSVSNALDGAAYPLLEPDRYANESRRLHDRVARSTRSLRFVDRDIDGVMDAVIEVAGDAGGAPDYVQLLELTSPLAGPYDPHAPGLELVNRTLGEDGEPSQPEPGEIDDDRIELEGTFGAVAYSDVDGDGCTDAVVAGLAEWDYHDPSDWSGSRSKLLHQLTDGAGQCTGRFARVPVWMLLSAVGLMQDVDLLELNGDGLLDMVFTGPWQYVTGVPGGDPANLMLASSGGPMYWMDETASRVPAFDVSRYGRSARSTTCDLDGDGDVDIVQATRESLGRFLINDGTGVFNDVPLPAQSLTGGVSTDVLCVDLSGPDGRGMPDGLPEVLFARRGQVPRNILLLNNTAGQSLDLHNGSSLLPQQSGSTQTAAVCDLEGDGDLDLLLGNGIPAGQPERDRVLIRDHVSGRFTPVAGSLGLDFDQVLGITTSIQCTSLDGDASMDAILVGSYGGQNRLYLRRRP